MNYKATDLDTVESFTKEQKDLIRRVYDDAIERGANKEHLNALAAIAYVNFGGEIPAEAIEYGKKLVE